MRVSDFGPMLLALGFALAGCGDEGAGGVASIPSAPITVPPPPPPPPPTPPPLIPSAASSQQFAAIGAAHPGGIDSAPLLDTGEQLQVRYVESSNSYEIQLPHTSSWAALTTWSPEGPAWFPGSFGSDIGGLNLRKIDYQYSNLFRWGDRNSPNTFGFEAIGIATAVGAAPAAGTANYTGLLLGSTPEVHPDDDIVIGGAIGLSFNFGLGTLSGSVSPMLLREDGKTTDLSPMAFRETVYSTGSTTFSGKFDTSLPGINSFSGLFTGPHAEELIGNFAFPYQSPIDSKTYQADGAFVGKK